MGLADGTAWEKEYEIDNVMIDDNLFTNRKIEVKENDFDNCVNQILKDMQNKKPEISLHPTLHFISQLKEMLFDQ